MFEALRRVERIDDVGDDTFFVVSGNGYPGYLDRIGAAVCDINNNPGLFTHLLVAVDAEDVDPESVRGQVIDAISHVGCPLPSIVVVHQYCIETWFLGNRRIVSPAPAIERLVALLAWYNVRERDPERMESTEAHQTTAQLHLEYLRLAFQDRGIAYTKLSPGPVGDRGYLEQLVRRSETGHLSSFRAFLEAMRRIGGRL